jgi:hypothetical protein
MPPAIDKCDPNMVAKYHRKIVEIQLAKAGSLSIIHNNMFYSLLRHKSGVCFKNYNKAAHRLEV